jgi:hypothetical protein
METVAAGVDVGAAVAAGATGVFCISTGAGAGVGVVLPMGARLIVEVSLECVIGGRRGRRSRFAIYERNFMEKAG